jgi:hypothetical protein
MSLEIRTKQIMDNFDSSSSNDILEVLNQIQETFQNKITRDYLQGKLKTILDASNEDQKKKLCKNLKPYLDWYLQGL